MGGPLLWFTIFLLRSSVSGRFIILSFGFAGSWRSLSLFKVFLMIVSLEYFFIFLFISFCLISLKALMVLKAFKCDLNKIATLYYWQSFTLWTTSFFFQTKIEGNIWVIAVFIFRKIYDDRGDVRKSRWSRKYLYATRKKETWQRLFRDLSRTSKSMMYEHSTLELFDREIKAKLL